LNPLIDLMEEYYDDKETCCHYLIVACNYYKSTTNWMQSLIKNVKQDWYVKII
jgi:hypothetical protein